MSNHLMRKLPQQFRVMLLLTALVVSNVGPAAATQHRGEVVRESLLAGFFVSAQAQQPKPPQPPPKKSLRERIIAWLKNLTEIRDIIVAYEPEGQIARDTRLTFRWKSDVTPAHYIIRILDQSTEETKWSSPPIPGTNRAFTARLSARTLAADSYNWQVEAYSEKDSATFSVSGEQSFSFLSPAETAKVIKQKKIILRWMKERPRDEQLTLLLGAYYAAKEMNTPARDALAKYLKIANPKSLSFEEVKSQVAARTEDVSAQLYSRQNALVGIPAGLARAQKLEELMRLSLLAFDYDLAMRYLEELISLSSGKVRDRWKRMKASLVEERTLWRQIFAEDTARRETKPAAIGHCVANNDSRSARRLHVPFD